MGTIGLKRLNLVEFVIMIEIGRNSQKYDRKGGFR